MSRWSPRSRVIVIVGSMGAGEAAELINRRRRAIEQVGAPVVDVTDIRPRDAASGIVALVRLPPG